MFAGCWQIIWAVCKVMWVRGPGYCQLIWAENRDVCRSLHLRQPSEIYILTLRGITHSAATGRSSTWTRSWQGWNWVDGIFGGSGLQPIAGVPIGPWRWIARSHGLFSLRSLEAWSKCRRSVVCITTISEWQPRFTCFTINMLQTQLVFGTHKEVC